MSPQTSAEFCVRPVAARNGISERKGLPLQPRIILGKFTDLDELVDTDARSFSDWFVPMYNTMRASRL
jgi:hypothetical protein